MARDFHLGLFLPDVLINDAGKGVITDVVPVQMIESFRSAKTTVLGSKGTPMKQGDLQDGSK